MCTPSTGSIRGYSDDQKYLDMSFSGGIPETDQKEKFGSERQDSWNGYIFNLERDFSIELENPIEAVIPTEKEHSKPLPTCPLSEASYGSEVPDENTSTDKTKTTLSKVVDTKSEVSDQPDFIRNLALRADVMNKNTFRALRRESKRLYETFLKDNGLPNPKRSNRKYLSNIKMFANYLLLSSEIDLTLVNSIAKDQFVLYLGAFINYCAMKNSLKNKEQLAMINELHQLLYTYSHGKFYNFLRIPEVSLMMQILHKRIGEETILSGNASLAAHKPEYRAHMARLLAHMAKKIHL